MGTEQNQQSPWQRLFDFQNDLQMKKFQDRIKPMEVTMGPERTTIDVANQDYQAFMQKHNSLESVLQKQQEDLQMQQGELQRRELAARANPLVHILGTLAANVAQQENMPGITQALGRTAMQLNPRPEQFQAQRMALQKQQMELSKLGMEGAQSAYQVSSNERNLSLRAQEQARKEAKDAIVGLMGHVEKVSSNAIATGAIEPKSTYASYLALGASPKMAGDFVAAQMELAAAVKEEKEARLGNDTKRANAAEKRANDAHKEVMGLADKISLQGKEWDRRHDETVKDQKALKEQQTEEDRKRRLNAATIPPPAVQEKLVSLQTSMDELANFKEVLKKTRGSQGPIAGRIAEYFAWRTPEEQALIASTSRGVLSMMSSMGQSVSRASDRDTKMLEKAAAGNKLTPEQNAEVVGIMDKMNRNALAAHVKMYPSEDFWVPRVQGGLFKGHEDLFKGFNQTPKNTGSQELDFGPDGRLVPVVRK